MKELTEKALHELMKDLYEMELYMFADRVKTIIKLENQNESPADMKGDLYGDIENYDTSTNN